MQDKSFLDNSFTSPINWQLLSKAHEYYSKFFLYKETPFIVPEYFSSITKPHTNSSFILNEDMFQSQPHELVGSAEQGFIYLLLTNKISNGSFFSITPCFRADNYDKIHFPWFMKLEIFECPSNLSRVIDVLDICLEFFKKNKDGNYQIVKTSDMSWDINLNNIEIGSYGIRNINKQMILYATGLALPRFSIV